ncbi:hypothetical protein PMI16_02750 [Herbaspirillum sp. CF444]|nr:hypothetical protein PMI16_02750 [Herbaspirillum sp. CF444]
MSPGIQFAKTSQAKLTHTARTMQQATHELGLEFVALEESLRRETEHGGESSALIRRNPITTKLGNLLEKTSDAMNYRLFPARSNPNLKVSQLSAKLLGKKTPSLNEEGATFQYADLIDQYKLEMKLIMLFNYHPELAEVIENACKSKGAAVLDHLASSSPRAGVTIDAIDDMYAQVRTALEAGTSPQEITQALKEARLKLEATGGIFGRAAARIKENPSNNEQVDAKKIGNWIAQGKPIETTEAVRYGFMNKDANVVTTEDQALLEKLLQVAEFDTADVPPNTPLLLRECANRDQFSDQTEAPLRARLIVDQPFEAIDPRKTTSETTPLLQASSIARTTVDIEQVPMLLALKYVICGREDLVHEDVLRILNDADISKAFSQKNPTLADGVSHALRNPDNAAAMCLHRKLAAAELMKTFLEGGSAWDTAKDIAPYAGAGMLMEGVKNLIPDGLLKSVVTESFLGGADLGDNGMGCMAELRSQAMTVKGIEVGGIADLYEKTFGIPGSNMTTMLSHLVLLGAGATDPHSPFSSLAQSMGFKTPTGPLASITETQMKSFLTGSAVSIGMTTIYSAAGALSSNPGVLALVGAGAIMGTSISPAIGFGMLHSELSLAVKKRLYDGTLQAPESLNMEDQAAVTIFCRKEAMNQLMMQTGNGAGNIAFLLAPFASSAKLLGFAVPQELIDLALEPLMPGMENIVRVGAMDSHEASKRDTISKLKEKCIDEAAKGNAAPMTLDEFDSTTLSVLDKIAAEWSLKVAAPFVSLLGHADYPHLAPVA